MPVDTIAKSLYNTAKDEWERFAANVAAPLAASIIQPIWKDDTLERLSEILSPKQITIKPTLDLPPPMDQKTFQLAKTGLTDFIGPKEQNDASMDTDELDIDELVHDLLLTLAQDSTNYLQAKRSFFDQERKWSDSKELERTAELQNQVDSTKTVNNWGKVEQSLASVGLIASGIIGVAAGATGAALALGIGAIAFGGILLIDQILDDAAKKVVAGWIARGNQEEEANWVNRIQMFCGLSSFALSLGASPSTAVKVAMDVSRAVVGATKDIFEWRLSVQKSVVMELDAVSRLAQKSVDTLFTEIQEICETIRQFHENLHNIQEKRQQVAHSMLRFADA